MSEVARQIASFEAREAVAGVRFEAVDPRFLDLFPAGTRATVVAGGFVNTEGPVWTPDGLLFVDPARNRIVRYRRLAEGPEVTTFRYPSGQALDESATVAQNGAMGLTLDADDRLLSCETGNRRVTRTEPGGRVSVVADRFEGRRLNRPNDVVAARDGTIFFTDPAYMLPTPSEPVEQPPSVYRVAPAGELIRIADDIAFPNGLALSLDERTLYVADSDRFELRAIDLDAAGRPLRNRFFASLKTDKPGVPDGVKVDSLDNVYCGSGGGLWVFDRAGAHLGTVAFPDWPRNLAWGESDWRVLYVTAGTTVYRIAANVAGVPVGRALRDFTPQHARHRGEPAA
ncbi:MAG: SMP-30/gluconolactonase/LRE family protein [Rhizobiaceae bacterium]|nr:SMP-30/gluconolactonase/LRE family protein [Rhizobiaceae bacterium]